jgi:hypothetical protein
LRHLKAAVHPVAAASGWAQVIHVIDQENLSVLTLRSHGRHHWARHVRTGGPTFLVTAIEPASEIGF